MKPRLCSSWTRKCSSAMKKAPLRWWSTKNLETIIKPGGREKDWQTSRRWLQFWGITKRKIAVIMKLIEIGKNRNNNNRKVRNWRRDENSKQTTEIRNKRKTFPTTHRRTLSLLTSVCRHASSSPLYRIICRTLSASASRSGSTTTKELAVVKASSKLLVNQIAYFWKKKTSNN